MSHIRSAYLRSFPSTSSQFLRRSYNNRNARKVDSTDQKNTIGSSSVNNRDVVGSDNIVSNVTERHVIDPSETFSAPPTISPNSVSLVNGNDSEGNRTETHNDSLKRLEIVNTTVSNDMELGVPLPSFQKAKDVSNQNGKVTTGTVKENTSLSGVDLNGKFFLIVPENMNPKTDPILIVDADAIMNPKHSKSILDNPFLKAKDKLIPFQLNPRVNPPIHFPSLDSLEIKDFDTDENFDFLDLPNLKGPNSDSINDLLNNIGKQNKLVVASVSKQPNINIVTSREEIDATDEIFDDKSIEITSIEDLFKSPLPHFPQLDPTFLNGQRPDVLEGFVHNEEFYNIVTNILKLDAPVDNTNKNSMFPSTGIPLPDPGPEITTKRPDKPFLVNAILPKPPNDLDVELLNLNDFSPGFGVPLPDIEQTPESATKTTTGTHPTDINDTEVVYPLDDPSDISFPISDYNVTGLLNNLNFNLTDNTLSSLSENWKMSNKTATIVLVLLSSLAQAIKFNGQGLPQQYKVNSRPDPFSPALFATPFFQSSTFSPMPMHATSPDPRGSIPKLLSNFCDPLQPPACAQNSSTYCLTDFVYPIFEVETLLKNDPTLVDKYADVSDQTANDLVAHMSPRQENQFDYSYYNPGVYDITHWIGPEGYLCPSQVQYTTPRRARNVKGEWRVVVNDGHFYTQTIRMESCLYPLTPCRLLAPCFKSKCIQKYMYHRLLSMDPCHPSKGLFIDMYRLPSSCSCYAPSMLA